MIKVLVDTSFSMKELGKKDSLEIILKSLIDEFEKYNFEYQILDFCGEKLLFNNFQLKNQNLDFNLIDKNSILISDGLFEINKNFNKKGISIAVGIDADIKKLEKITKKVFEVDNILEISDYILFNFDIDNRDNNENEW